MGPFLMVLFPVVVVIVLTQPPCCVCNSLLLLWQTVCPFSALIAPETLLRLVSLASLASHTSIHPSAATKIVSFISKLSVQVVGVSVGQRSGSRR